MSLSQQFASSFEQPKLPSRRTAAWLGEQPDEQRELPLHAAASKFSPGYMSNGQAYAHPVYQYVYFIEHRAPATTLGEQIRLLEQPRRPEQVGELQHIPQERPYWERRQDLAPRELEQMYVFEDRSAITAFIKRNRLLGLLAEAPGPLNAAFGKDAVKKLTLKEDDEGFETLFCLILVPGDMLQAKLALKSFDEQWWLARSGEDGGKLNFDFDLI